MAIPGPSLNPPLMNTQTVSCRRSASWPGVSNLAKYTADSVVGRLRQRTSLVSTHRWLVSNDASWVRRPPLYRAVQCSPAQYKETDTHHNATMCTSSVSWVAVNNVAAAAAAAAAATVRSLHVTWNGPAPYQTVSTGSLLNRRSHSAEKYWIGPTQFWLDRAFSTPGY